MELERFADAARAIVAAESDDVPGFSALELDPEAPPHPLVRGAPALLSVTPDPDEKRFWRLVLHHGAFLAEAVDVPGIDLAELLDAAIVFGLGQVAERAALPRRPDEAFLLETLARFRRGDPVVSGWYRAGEPMAEGIWAVGADLFADLVLSRGRWSALSGMRLELDVLGEDVEIDSPPEGPPEAAGDEAWTLEEGGCFEPADQDADVQHADEDDLPGRVGDLHLVPLVF
jgi:hypothetical protein